MDDPDFARQYLITNVALFTAGGSLVGFLWKMFEARKAKRELAEIKRRGDAPFFECNPFPLSYLTVQDPSDGSMTHLDPVHGTLLCWCRNEIGPSTKPGAIVTMAIRNNGEPFRTAMFHLEGEEIAYTVEPEIPNANGVESLHYKYWPEKLGTKQLLTVTFETQSGYQGKHTYVLLHGRRSLRRIDPPPVA